MVFSCRWWLAGVFLVLLFPATSQAATIVWDNTSGDGLWSTCTNWATDACPGSADTVSFDGTNDTDSYADAAFTGTVDAISIAAGYTGTTTVQRSLTLDNTGGFSQAGGKVKIEGFNISLTGNGAWSQTGGEFHGTSTTITLDRSLTVDAAALMTLSTATTTLQGSETADDSTLTCTGTYPGLVSIAKTSENATFENASGCAITLANSVSTFGGVTFTGDVTTGQSLTITGAGASSTFAPTLTITGTVTATTLTALTLAGNLTVTDPTDLVNFTATTTFNGADADLDSTLTCTGTYPGLVNIAKTSEHAFFSNAAGCTITLANSVSTFGAITFTGNVASGQSLTITGAGSSSTFAPTLTIDGVFTATSLTALTLAGHLTVNDLSDLVNFTATTTFNGSDADLDSTLTCTGTWPDIIDVAKTGEFSDFTLAAGCNITFANSVTTQGHVTISGTATMGQTFTIDDLSSNTGAPDMTINNTIDATNLRNMYLVGNLTVGDVAYLTNYTATTTFNSNTGDADLDSTLTCTGTFPGLVDIDKADEFADFSLASGCNVTLAANVDTKGSVTNGGTMTTGVTFTISPLSNNTASPTFTNNGTWTATTLTALNLVGHLTINSSLSNFTATTTFYGGDTQTDSTLTCTGNYPGKVSIAKTDQFADFTLASGCNITLVSTNSTQGNVTLNGDVTTGTTFTIAAIANNTSAPTLTVNGGWTATTLTALNLVGGLTVNNSLANFTATTTFSGGDTQLDSTMTCSGTYPGPVSITKSNVNASFSLSSGCSVQSNSNISSSGAISISGTFDIQGYNFTGASVTVGGTGTLKLQGSNSSLTTPTLNAGSTVEYTGTGSYNSLKLGTNYYNLSISGSGTYTPWLTSVLGNFTQSAGTYSATGTTMIGGDFSQTGGTLSPTAPFVFASTTSTTVTTSAGTAFAGFNVNKSSIPLAAYYTLDSADLASNVKDSSYSGSTGYLVTSATTTTTGQIGQALTLNGTSEYIKIPNLIDLLATDITLSVWFQTSGDGAIFGYNLGGYSATPSAYVPAMYVGTDGLLRAQLWNGAGTPITTSGTVNNGAWHHAVLTVSGSTQTLYLDGSSVNTLSGAIVDFGATVSQIGTAYTNTWTGGNGGWFFFDGSLDDIRIYSAALSSSQVTELYNQQAITHTTGTLTLGGSGVTSSGDVTLADGTLDVSASGCSSASCSITLAGNWIGGNDLFTPRSGTVTLNGSSQSITGTTTFYNLSKTVSATDTLTFGSNQTQTIQNTWTAQGASGAVLSLSPSSAGVEWKIDPQGTRTLSYVTPSYSNNTNATAIQTAGFNMTDGGNNTNWQFNFDPDTPVSLGPTSSIDGSETNDDTPTFTFSLSDSDSGDDLRYHIQIDDSSDFSSPVVDSYSTFGSQGAKSFTPSSALSPASYYWRVRSSDGTATSSYATANGGGVAFRVIAVVGGGGVSGGGGGGGGGLATPTPLISSASAGSSLLLGPSGVEQGDLVTLVVLARNLYKANTNEGGDTVKITITGANPATVTAIDEDDGTYTVRYIATNQGTDKVTATLNGSSVGHDSDGKDDGTLNIKIAKRTKPLPPPPPEPEPTPEPAPEPVPVPEPAPEPPVEASPPPEPTPVPQAFQSGLTESCFRAFTWDGNAPTSVYRKIGNGHDALIAKLNPQTTWYIDIDPIENQSITYRISSPRHDETITFTAEEVAACAAPPTPPLVLEKDVDGDGEMEQYIDGVYQDADGSSSPIALAEEGILIDTDDNGSPDTYWLPGGNQTSLVVAAGDRLFILEGTLSGVQMFAPLTDPYYRVALALTGAHVAVAADAARAMPLIEPFGFVKAPPLPENAKSTLETLGVLASPILFLFGLLRAPFSLSDLGLLLARLYALIAGYASSKRRRYPWGTVYDSETKAPLDPAHVELFDETGRSIAEAYTDIDGRYGFLVSPGVYHLKAEKAHHAFPSVRLAGRTSDILYADLTFGEPITVGPSGTVVKNIPLDPTEFDWNQLEVQRRGLVRYYHWLDPAALALLKGFFYGGFALSLWSLAAEFSTFNAAVALLYGVLFAAHLWMPSPRLYGRITDAGGAPLAYAIVRLCSLATGSELARKVTDQFGRYHLFTPENRPYLVTVEQRTGPEVYTRVFEAVVRSRKGLINKTLVVGG